MFTMPSSLPQNPTAQSISEDVENENGHHPSDNIRCQPEFITASCSNAPTCDPLQDAAEHSGNDPQLSHTNGTGSAHRCRWKLNFLIPEIWTPRIEPCDGHGREKDEAAKKDAAPVVEADEKAGATSHPSLQNRDVSSQKDEEPVPGNEVCQFCLLGISMSMG